MHQTEILNEIIRLPISERIEVIESALMSVRKDLKIFNLPYKDMEQQQMSIAAETLYRDYLENKELTAFTVLDGETFYEER